MTQPEEVPLAAKVYALLVDGKFRSGEELAERLGVTRSGVWKAAVTLRALGVVIHAVRNRGYRLASPCELLEVARIREGLTRDARERVRQIDVARGASLLKQLAAAGTHATDLKSAGLRQLSRNAIVSSLIDSSVRGLVEFEKQGLRAFIEEWRGADALRGQMVNVHLGEQIVHGLARGVDISGALLVETTQGLRKFVSGEVTVRPEA